VDGDKFEAANAGILAENREKSNPCPSRPMIAESDEAVHLRDAFLPQNHGRPGANLRGNWLAANDLNFSERYLAAVNRSP